MSLTGWATKHKSRAVHSHQVLPHCHCFPRCPKNPWKTLDCNKTQFVCHFRGIVHKYTTEYTIRYIHCSKQQWFCHFLLADFDWSKKCQFSLLEGEIGTFFPAALFACLAKCHQPYRPLLPDWRKIVEQQGFGWELLKLVVSSSCLQNKLSRIISPNQNYSEEQLAKSHFRTRIPFKLAWYDWNLV